MAKVKKPKKLKAKKKSTKKVKMDKSKPAWMRNR
tara:strand:- start:706 stop:807 length:102 start_codon:yes stop_codon:yes gene_type:complete